MIKIVLDSNCVEFCVSLHACEHKKIVIFRPAEVHDFFFFLIELGVYLKFKFTVTWETRLSNTIKGLLLDASINFILIPPT